MLWSLFQLLILRRLRDRPLVSVLTVVSIALGVAVFLAIRITNTSATAAFQSTLDVVSGRSHLVVSARTEDLDEDFFPQVAQVEGIAAATPLVEGYAVLPEHPGEYLHLFGVDLFTNAPFLPPQTEEGFTGEFDTEAFLSQAATVSLSEAMRERCGLVEGEAVLLEIDGRRVEVQVSAMGSEAFLGSGQSSHQAIMDIGWAQELLGRVGGLSSVQVRLENPREIDLMIERLRGQLGQANLAIAPPEARSRQVGNMLSGFQLNLTALSLIALLVGVFLVYSTSVASVVQRRPEIGTLKSLGASPAQIRGLFLGEALCFGALGIVLGSLGGILLARALTSAVGETISAHYLLLTIENLALAPTDFVWGALAGLTACVVGSLAPAAEAARVDPVQALHPGRLQERQLGRVAGMALWGLLLIGLAGLLSWLALETGPPWLSFLACLSLTFGCALPCPWVADRLGKGILRSSLVFPVSLQLGFQTFQRSLHRSGVTIAALMTALAMTTGVTLMIASFRDTVGTWIGQSMHADLYLTPAANEVLGLQSLFPTTLYQKLQQAEWVEKTETVREVPLTLVDGEATTLRVIDARDGNRYRFLGGDHLQKFQAAQEEGAVMVSEAYARRFQVGEGDSIWLPTPQGEREFQIAGVYFDYSDDRGRIVLWREHFRSLWQEDRFHSLSLTLRGPLPPERAIEKIRELAAGEGALQIYSNRTLRERVFEIFDQTFAITYALRGVALVVAVLGIVLTLTTLIRERAREVSVLRSLGGSPWQVQALHWTEAGCIGLVSSLVGVGCGFGLALILTWVVNRAFFGWTIQFAPNLTDLLLTPLAATLAAIVASLLPAKAAASQPIASSLRTE
ncbi:MAG: FtsX-like permease family protein [Verrucomicrobiota bacterium]